MSIRARLTQDIGNVSKSNYCETQMHGITSLVFANSSKLWNVSKSNHDETYNAQNWLRPKHLLKPPTIWYEAKVSKSNYTILIICIIYSILAGIIWLKHLPLEYLKTTERLCNCTLHPHGYNLVKDFIIVLFIFYIQATKRWQYAMNWSLRISWRQHTFDK